MRWWAIGAKSYRPGDANYDFRLLARTSEQTGAKQSHQVVVGQSSSRPHLAPPYAKLPTKRPKAVPHVKRKLASTSFLADHPVGHG